MKSFLRRYLFLFLSISFVGLALWFWKQKEGSAEKESERELKEITHKVNRELRFIDFHAKSLIKTIEDTNHLSFSILLRQTKYPYFIFKNTKLFFWSDNRVPVKYDALRGNYQYQYTVLASSKYLVSRYSIQKNGEPFEIFFLLPLAHESTLDNTFNSSGLSEEIFQNPQLRLTSAPSRESYDVKSKDGDYLFSIQFYNPSSIQNGVLAIAILVCSIIAILFLLIFLSAEIDRLNNTGHTDLAIFLLLLTIVFVRGVMLYLNYPFSLLEFDLFNSKYFASSSIAPSLGDLLLNISGIGIFCWYVFRNYSKSWFLERIFEGRSSLKFFASIGFVLLSYYALYFVFYTFRILYLNSQWSLDITVNIDFNFFRILCLVIFILTSFIFFISSNVFSRLFIRINNNRLLPLIMYFTVGTGLYIGSAYFLTGIYWPIVVINGIYFLLITYVKFPKYIRRLRYLTYIYFLIAALVCSLTGAYAIYDMNFEKAVINKTKFASQLLIDNDVLAEYLLNVAKNNIKRDEFIKNTLLSPFASKQLIEQKIRRAFLPNYFEKFDVNILLLDISFKDQTNKSYKRELADLKYEQYKTEFKDIYFVHDRNGDGSNKYTVVNEIVKNGSRIGYIVLELKNKKIAPHSVLPTLLLNKDFNSSTPTKEYSYAIFELDELINSFGDFNYEKEFKTEWLKDEDLYLQGISLQGFHHLGAEGELYKTIVVSSPLYSLTRAFSNFSFLFLILIIFVLFTLSTLALYFRSHQINTSYSTKIQIYLNIAFFLPLFVVSFTTLSIISSSYKENLNSSFINKADGISDKISGYLDNYSEEDIKKDSLETSLFQLAQYTESDINLFDKNGKLIFSNQPIIYEMGFLSKMINPKALSEIFEKGSKTVMLSESVGGLSYNGVYVGVKSRKDGRLTGILSIPFFESKHEMDKQIIDVLTTITNIFVSIFILFLFLSYLASSLLTVPLRIITQKLKSTSLGAENEPIEWNSQDEIGMLVGEYNEMLIKLEESKKALSQGEKESAWREMAQQVAHEIKNPLTPMKLTIQYLQRGIKEKVEGMQGLVDRSLNTLLVQVDNLNEIATSFSMFAKMPSPKNERFKILPVLGNTISLHNNNNGAVVRSSMPSGDYYVIGDSQIMSGIITNLIINGIQSVPNNRKPIIQVNVRIDSLKILIEVKDNGSGIPESIRNKVFIPNFSTKYSGSGIGLAVAKRGVEHAGGRIWFETAEGVGTSFFIELPLTV